MKQTLQFKLGQQLTMTPQLQQAIRLLQLSTLELQQEIQQILDTNPMLEIVEEFSSTASQETEKNTDETSVSDQLNDEHIPDELAVDSDWEDIYEPGHSGEGNSTEAGFSENRNDNRNATTETLQDYLLWQLNLTPMTNNDRLIAESIIDAIDPSGMLNQSAEDLHQGLAKQWPEEDPLELDEVLAVLHRIQQFDPPGVASHDLRECLLIQLNQLHPDTPWLLDAKLVVSEYLDLLANRDFNQLMRKAEIRQNTLIKVIELIQSLNPYPGTSIETSNTEYITPDAYVFRKKGRWVVRLNQDVSPNIRINELYASMIKRADNSRDNTFLKNNLQEARWFLKSLESRNETIYKVACAIIDEQQGFLDYGPEAMKPMVLHDIAERVEMHESTISRVTNQKYIHTPRGIFELKFFFSSHVSTSGGGECSSTAIRALIKKMISNEPEKKPLSDNKIAQLLEKEGINVARRTIAKYRESMNIPPSNERKQLCK
ncbi:MAG: RNA polymerase factor sigma-54 [Pseudomonadales bacterium]|nr:RNA polymerase factor sigma-54 [Pseudomonadales bacterium]